MDQNTLENSLKDRHTRPPYLPPEKPCQGFSLACQEAAVRAQHETMDWFKIGKGISQSCILSPCLFNLHAEYIVQNAGLKSRLLGEISPTPDMQMIPR